MRDELQTAILHDIGDMVEKACKERAFNISYDTLTTRADDKIVLSIWKRTDNEDMKKIHWRGPELASVFIEGQEIMVKTGGIISTKILLCDPEYPSKLVEMLLPIIMNKQQSSFIPRAAWDSLRTK